MSKILRFSLERGSSGYGFTIKDEGENSNDTVLVSRVQRNSPASHAGIRVGQRIMLINGRPVKSMGYLQAFNEIRGSKCSLQLEVVDPLHGSELEQLPEIATSREDQDLSASTYSSLPTSKESSTGAILHLSTDSSSTSDSSPCSGQSNMSTTIPSFGPLLSDTISHDVSHPLPPLSTAHENPRTFEDAPRSHHLTESNSTNLTSYSHSPFDSSFHMHSPDSLSRSPLKGISPNHQEQGMTFIRGSLRSSSRREAEDHPQTTLKFVRKRAYASARHRNHSGHPSATSPKQDTLADTAVNIPYHRRPAASLPTSPQDSIHNEPRVTHLPRRRSTKTRSDGRPKPYAARLAVFSDFEAGSGDITPLPVEPASRTPRLGNRLSTENTSAALVTAPPMISPRKHDSPHAVPKPEESKSAISDFHDLLHGNFDQTSGDLWSRAGEAYRSIDLADRFLAEKLALKRHQADQSHCTVGVELNKENDFAGTPENWLSDRYASQPFRSYPDQSSPLSLKSTASTTHWTQFRNFCSTSRGNRPEAKDILGGFLSPQCLCKVLTLDGKTSKRHTWKIYQMCVSGDEVKFARNNFAARGNRRTLKINKYSKEPLNKSSFVSDLISCSPSVNSMFDASISTTTAAESDNEHFRHPVPSSSSSSCIILPIQGLLWHMEDSVPADLPVLGSKKPTKGQQHVSTMPDLMNPIQSSISDVPNSLDSGEEVSSLSDKEPRFRCYRFNHPQARVELLFVFPDEAVASTCLKMLEISGGKEMCPVPQIKRNASSSQELIVTEAERNRFEGTFVDNVIPYSNLHASHHTTPNARESSTAIPSTRLKWKERRHRFADGRTGFMDTPNNKTDSKYSTEGANHVDLTESHSPIRTQTPGFRSTSKGQFLQSIKQLLNRSTVSSSPMVGVPHPTPSQPSGVHDLDKRLMAVLGENPDFSDLETPGPFFGNDLEKQVESPDYQYIPVLLHVFVLALESHGLHQLGLYRKPGRHRSINQFICVSNLVPRNLDIILSLDAWNETHALCGLVKHFLRRLPVRLLDLTTWVPVASLVSEKQSPVDFSRMAYLLLSIRVKLWKMASRAFGSRDKQLQKNEAFELTSSTGSLPGLRRNSPDTSVPSNKSPIVDSPSQLPMDPIAAKWHWYTFKYVIEHLRRVVSFERRNEVTYKCAAICFGPVLFGDTLHFDKLNTILELVLEHWPWLIKGLPVSEESSRVDNLPSPNRDLTLADTITYLERCSLKQETSVNESLFELTSVEPSCPSPTTTAADVSPIGIRETVKRVMDRAYAKIDNALGDQLSKSQCPDNDNCNHRSGKETSYSSPSTSQSMLEQRSSHSTPNIIRRPDVPVTTQAISKTTNGANLNGFTHGS